MLRTLLNDIAKHSLRELMRRTHTLQFVGVSADSWLETSS